MHLHLFSQQMTLNTDHDVLKIIHRNKTGTVFVGSSKTFDSVLLVKVVQELAELAVTDESLFVFSEVQLYERWVHVKRYPFVELRLTHHLTEFSCGEGSISYEH